MFAVGFFAFCGDFIKLAAFAAAFAAVTVVNSNEGRLSETDRLAVGLMVAAGCTFVAPAAVTATGPRLSGTDLALRRFMVSTSRDLGSAARGSRVLRDL